MDTRTVLVLLLALLFALLTWRVQRRHRDDVRRRRRGMWDRCLARFEQPQLLQDDVGFPVLRGLYRGYKVALEPIADHIAYRKLPQLWLRATVFARLPIGGALDYLVRPENVEFYSALWSLPVNVPVPAAWPQHALLRSDIEVTMPLLDLISPHIGMFEDAKLKELVVTGNGVRTVYQLEQGQRARYAIFRSPHFDQLQVQPETVQLLMNRMLALVADLEKVAVR